jgi:hypothetical protein
MSVGSAKVYTAQQQQDLLRRLLEVARRSSDLDRSLKFYKLAIGVASNASQHTGFAERITEEAVDRALEESARVSGFSRKVKENPRRVTQPPKQQAELAARLGDGNNAISAETKKKTSE